MGLWVVNCETFQLNQDAIQVRANMVNVGDKHTRKWHEKGANAPFLRRANRVYGETPCL